MNKGKWLLERQIGIRPSILSQSSRKIRSTAPLLSGQNGISVFCQKVIWCTVSMGKRILGEVSVSHFSPLKSGDILPIPQTSEVRGPKSDNLWQRRVESMVEALLWNQLTTDQIPVLLLLAGHLGEATDTFWNSNASFGKWGQTHLMERVMGGKCYFPGAW